MKNLTLAIVICGLFMFQSIGTAEEQQQNQQAANAPDDHIYETFRFAYNEKRAEKSGAINSYSHDDKPEEVSAEILAAIKKNPGLETGGGFRTPLNLESSDTDCELVGLKTQLSEHPDTNQWLVAPLPPCGKNKYAQLNSPFWLVEEKTGKLPRVLLAYRAHRLSILAKQHEEYAEISTTYQSPLDGNEIDITWRYQGQEYDYHSSVCSNLGPVNANEPLNFTDCAPVEDWSTQAERETGS